MQDQTIDSALIALHRQGGHQGGLAKVLMDMRGVKPRRKNNVKLVRRGETRGVVLRTLRSGPATGPQITDLLQEKRPDLTRKQAWRRVHAMLLSMRDRGEVLQDFGPEGCLWRVP